MTTPGDTRARRQLAAILSADAVGYSRRMAADEGATVAAMRSHRETLGGFVREHHGRVVNAVGDNLLAEFASAVDATACAVAAQHELARREAHLPDEQRLRLRIGVHLGDLVIEDDEIFGDGINIASRLEALAAPGGVAASAVVVDQVRGKVDAVIEDMGDQVLKNIPLPVHVYRLRPLADGEVADATVHTVPGFGGRPTIAILPFEHRGADDTQAFLADGITEDLIARLSAFRLFPVISRSSMFTYQGKRADARQVSRELGARYVVEGSVQRVGGRLRVGVQLIDGLQGVQVTSERWDRELGDVLALQDDIVHVIVGSIEPALSRAERQRAQRKSAPQLDAWESFQRGRWLLFGFRSDDEMREAVRLFQRARELDPAFASAAALESIAHVVQITYLWSDGPEVGAEALRLAELSLALAEDDPWGQTALGYACGLTDDHAREITAFERALELNPSLTMAYDGLAGALGVEHPDEAVRIAEKAIRLSPRDPQMHFLVHRIAVAHLIAGRFADAAARDEESLRLRADQPHIYRTLAASYG
ncbi:MAG: adenylate/guanylate cyclase domain-containing protein, partial [Candidatus Binatia bacterium]